jgi:hypothetical protein
LVRASRFVHFMALDVEDVREQDLERWYEQIEQPRVASTNGYVGVKRAVAVRGEPRHLLLYDLESPTWSRRNRSTRRRATAATGYSADGPSTPGLLGWDGPAEHALYEQFFPADGLYQGVEWGDGQTPVGGLRVPRL